MPKRIAVFLTGLLAVAALGRRAVGAEIKVLTAGAMRGVLAELLPPFERDTGHKVAFEWRFLLLSLLALLPLSARLDAALPKQGLTPQETSLTGQLLVASPRMGDPRFQRTVILMVKHDKKGALGITINRPLGVRPLAMVLENLGDTVAPGTATVRIFAGGPVQTEIGFVIHSADYDRQETLRINTDLAMTASPDVLRDMVRNQGPKKALVAFGYAGWSAGQLEAELARDDWLVATADPALVFDTPRERVWDEAMARRAQ